MCRQSDGLCFEILDLVLLLSHPQWDKCFQINALSLPESEAGSLRKGDERCRHFLHQQSAERLQGNVSTVYLLALHNKCMCHWRITLGWWKFIRQTQQLYKPFTLPLTIFQTVVLEGFFSQLQATTVSAQWGWEMNVTKHEKILKHYLIQESQRGHFHLQEWLFNNKDNKSHDIILFTLLSRDP